jgi:hypothetical protein
MRLAIVIPTIDGREDYLACCLDAYQRTAPDAQMIVERDHPSCGAGWIAGAAKAADFELLHFGADDLEPHDGWLDVAVETVEAGYIPAPLVFNVDGTLDSAGLAGPQGQYRGPYVDWQLVEGTTVPFLTRQMWETIGMVDVHYCSDLWVSTVGRRHGWETVIRPGMRFTHHAAPAAWRTSDRSNADRRRYVEALA